MARSGFFHPVTAGKLQAHNHCLMVLKHIIRLPLCIFHCVRHSVKSVVELQQDTVAF